tara:strand:+ start:15450 stop:15725 length:276 start_codon:yes stop_codon:yes gene_type:complete
LSKATLRAHANQQSTHVSDSQAYPRIIQQLKKNTTVINYADGDSDANMDLFLYHETMKPFLKNMKIHRLQERTKILHTLSVDRKMEWQGKV